MATMTVNAAAATSRRSNAPHRIRVAIVASMAAGMIVYLALHGFA